MKTLFAQFEQYADAQAAVDHLLNAGFTVDEMNVIVQTQVIKNELDVNQSTMHVDVTDKIGEQTLHGLAGLLSGRQPVRTTQVGAVYAVGELATVVSHTAAGADNTGNDMQSILVEFGVPAETAARYIDNLRNGSLLFWLRAEDERAGLAGDALRTHQGQHMVNM